MDSPAADRFLFLSRAMLGLALLALGVRLARQPGNKLNMATGFALSCVTMLAVSPVARAHYFLLLAPAILLVPLWLDRHGRPRAGIVMAAIPPVLSILHYVLLPYGGRVGLLGFGTAAWLMAAMVLIARADWATVRAARARDVQSRRFCTDSRPSGVKPAVGGDSRRRIAAVFGQPATGVASYNEQLIGPAREETPIPANLR